MHLFVVEWSFLKAWVALCSSFGSSLPYAVCHNLFGRAASLWIVPFREGEHGGEGEREGPDKQGGGKEGNEFSQAAVCVCVYVAHSQQ